MKIQNRKGQALLIIVMLLATIITVVMTVAFNSTTETQVARLEADSQKALAAAEAGVDAVIATNSTGSVNIGNLGQFGAQNISGNAQLVGVPKPYFVTPLLQKDEQYTFYLSDYPGFGNPWNGSFDIYFDSEGGCPSIEVVIVENDNSLVRKAFNTCPTNTITNADPSFQPGSPVQIDTTTFQWKTQTPLTTLPKSGRLAFVKVLNGRTKLGFQAIAPATSFPIQGKTVDSEARTESGVVKKVELFQSYPQIPSNFLMTSF